MLNSNKPFVWIERIFGGIPYEIGANRLFVTKPSIIYAFSFTISIMAGTAVNIYLNTDDYSTLTFFRILRTAFGWINFTINIIAIIYWKNHLQSAYNHVHIYDICAKFHQNKRGPSQIYFQICAMAVVTCWVIVGWLSGQDIVEYPTLHIFAYVSHYGCQAVQVLNFYSWMLLLYRRFHHLTQLIDSSGNAYDSSSINFRLHYTAKIILYHDAY